MSEELKNSILSRSIDIDQLDRISGGVDLSLPSDRKCANVSRRDDCQATVELGSWCGSNDACFTWDCEYDGCGRSEADPAL